MFLLLIKDINIEEYIDHLITLKRFLSMYKSMSNMDPFSGYNADKFIPSQIIAM